MRRELAVISVGLWLAAVLPGAAAAQDSRDPEVLRGVGLVDEGEYDSAILALDSAARRLAAQTTRSADLGVAYLYLGVAYLAKGHETSAKARFREALAQVRDLKLSPERFAPKVIEVFEKARAEESASPGASPAGRRKGGGKGLLLLGLGGAAAAGVAVAAGGGGGDSGPAAGSSAPGTESFNGTLGSTGGEAASINAGPFATGACRADLSWTDAGTEVRMFVNDAATSAGVAETRRVSGTSSTADWTCASGIRYRIDLFLQEPRLNVSYELRVSHP